MSAAIPQQGGVWPDLTLADWADTRDTLHLWSQVVGKIRLALEPMVNHWWQVPLYVTARGLTTSVMPAGARGLEVEFDFRDDVLRIDTTDGASQRLPLEPMPVADFYAGVIGALDAVGVEVRIFPQPVEIADAIPFPDDEQHCSYDADAVRRFWTALVHGDRILRRFRAGFVGKASPVHFFWGSFDLAVTRFSGRPAPRHPGGVPNCPDRVQHLAYSHELSSCGFWPGGSSEGSFYAYAYPSPDGFAEWTVDPPAYFDYALGEFLLPYGAVRRSANPDAVVESFLQATYEGVAELAGWDRDALEAST